MPVQSLLSGWRPALRLAWRDTVRNKARSALVLVMISLPVLAVTAAAVVIKTQDLSSAESADRRLGAADALVIAPSGVRRVAQGADPERGSMFTHGEGAPAYDVAALESLLEREVPAQPIVRGYVDVRVGDRSIEAAATEVDLGDPLARGLFTLEGGRWPRAVDEVVVNRALAERGIGLGDALPIGRGLADVTVVGIGEDASSRAFATVAGPVGSLGVQGPNAQQATWLIGGGDVSWTDVRAINETGAAVVSRAVLADPPSDSELGEEVRANDYGSGSSEAVAVVVLVVTMALLEVVLLAGPAFAVGARRQSRALALMAACGGTPVQARRVVLASGVVLGGLGAAIGVLLGVLVALAVMPLVQRFNEAWFGPFEVPLLVVAGIAGFGLLSALLAAVVPAFIASRQDVVAVLAGRRGDRAPSMKSPIVGLVLLGAGVLLAVSGARQQAGGETPVAFAAVISIFGMILLVPVVVSAVSRLAGRLPLSLRYAARDAARHRTRTVPAVAAVAATVAGVVTLGISTTSDARENKETYQPTLAMGDGMVTISSEWSMATNLATPPSAASWSSVEALVRDRVPGAVKIMGVAQSTEAGEFWPELSVPGHEMLLSSWGGGFNAALVVSPTWPEGIAGLDDAQRAVADEALAAGRAVVFTDQGISSDEVKVSGQVYHPDLRQEDMTKIKRTWPALLVEVPTEMSPVQAVIPPALAEDLGQPVMPAGILLEQSGLSVDQQKSLQEVVAAVDNNARVYIERGYQDDDVTVIVQLVLGALGGILMLGGTLTATFLALSDARPDLATLSAVGASPRSRRRVAASYALVVGFVGAILGAAVGFIPGLAISVPLTRHDYGGAGPQGPFIDVPWLMIGTIVLALPLLTALLVGLTARSKLPLVSRLD